jgi:Cu/Ag efflux protein CusF
MKPITVALITFFTLCVTSHIIFQTHEARAEMSEALAASEAAVAVDVIVGIDSETRTITLKNEAGEEYTYTAGPEVKNFDQLERGDQVIMSYFSGFVFTLNPTGATGEESVTDVAIATAKEGEKPGIAVSASKNVTAVVAEIDKPNRIVILQGPERLLALKVSDRVDLDTVEVGQEVEAFYTESYAIAVEPAPEVSGTISMESKTVAVGLGVSWGSGTLTMYDGTTHQFSLRGLSVIDVGITGVEATGEVFNLVEAKDLEGDFVAGEAGATLIGGGSVMALRNSNGVVLKLRSKQQGLRLTLSGAGLRIRLK